MNLFRSEEHVKRWSLYDPASEDYIMALADWAQAFSGPMHRSRLDPDYLARSAEHLAAYHGELQKLGKTTSFWMIPFIRDLQGVPLARFRVVGDYIRYEEQVLHSLKDVRARIAGGFDQPGHRRNNHLIWAPPGSGKTYFVQQVARTLQGRVDYLELNLARTAEDAFRRSLESLPSRAGPLLVLVDEIDARTGEAWPYEALLPYLDLAAEGRLAVGFVLAGSASYSLDEMKRLIALRSKGKDVLSRVPGENEAVIPSMSFGDRVLVMLSQLRQAGLEIGREIRAVEKLALYYAAVNPRLVNVRQLREFAVRAAERISPGDDRVKYDNLFEPGDPKNKAFWVEVQPMAGGLVGRFVDVGD